VDALSVQELLAILLGTGTRGKPVLVLAQELLFTFGGMNGLLNASIESLIKVKGIGKAKAIMLKAAFGIALRASKETTEPFPIISSVEDIINLAEPQIGNLKKEALFVILLDVRARLIHSEVIALGTLSEVLAHPREVFQAAIRHGAYSLIVCHNHPSGDPTPSDADMQLTVRFLECAKLVGIALADHVIIGKGKHFSIKKGDFPKKTALKNFP
jgi:DNA repair protein RadC